MINNFEQLKKRLVKAGSLDPNEQVLNFQYEDIIAWHQEELKKAVEAERERIVKHFSQYLREWQDGMEDNSPTVKISWVIDQLLAPTKTDKQTEV